MKLYRTARGPVVEDGGRHFLLAGAGWDVTASPPDLLERLRRAIAKASALPQPPAEKEWLAPVGAQEIWAAGVTYFRSRDARIEESKAAGGGDFYARVYEADRPELFFKATPHRVAGHLQPVRIRRDSKWNVPEPELALFVSSAGTIEGYTIGNDMSSRDIEGENPLYLPQAKVYDACCGLGPGLLVADGPLPTTTAIKLAVMRGSAVAFEGSTTLSQLKRSPEELVSWLFRESSFPQGCVLLTGTGIIPPADFGLQPGDVVKIEIEGIGELVNPVQRAAA